MKETLVELLNMLFQRDNKTIDDIIEKFNCKEEDYTRPPENYNVSELINTDCPQTNCEFVEGFYHTEETKSNGLNIKKDYTKDAKYLASITENGIWIKDEVDENILFINAKKIELDNLSSVLSASCRFELPA